MTRDEIRNAVLQALSSIAPEFDSRNLQPDAVRRQELDLDSMDFLNFVIGLHDSVGINVPEQDYAKLSTLNGAVDYLVTRLTA